MPEIVCFLKRAFLVYLFFHVIFTAHALGKSSSLPSEFLNLLSAGHNLPRYSESYYHPLGRSPVVDAVLNDPFYLPTYGRSVSNQLRNKANQQSCAKLLETAFKAGAYPFTDMQTVDVKAIPGLNDVFNSRAAKAITIAWSYFFRARKKAALALAQLSSDEQQYLLDHPDSYFFGEDGGDEYDFFTTNTKEHLKVFQMAAKIDLALLADAARDLAAAVDTVKSYKKHIAKFDGYFIYETDSISLVIAGSGTNRHTDDIDFLIDVGGDDVYKNNAGGTGGSNPAALTIDIGGNDRYEGSFACQGAGYLGVGGLADFAGNDQYSGGDFCQGAGFFGTGFLFDLSGDDNYRAEFFCQSAAAFGSSLLWDFKGNDRYESTGMAQAGASTLGAAFLVESSGDDTYDCGKPRPKNRFWTRAMGIGQGGAAGVRDYPWIKKQSFYGGVAFLDDANGNDKYNCQVFCQGGSYFLSAGILIDGGGDDIFIAQSGAQGGTIHLTAGLMINDGGDDYYDGGWGSNGVGGDRSIGIFIDTEGKDQYYGETHNIGTARKPHAVGLFIDIAGDDTYQFSNESCGHVQQPSDPSQWPYALFLDLGGHDVYPDSADILTRGNDLSWSFGLTGKAVDTDIAGRQLASKIYNAFHSGSSLSFDPINGWADNIAFTPYMTISDTFMVKWMADLKISGYDKRRRLYEQLDLVFFADSSAYDKSILTDLLTEISRTPDDLTAYAAVWCTVDSVKSSLPILGNTLAEENNLSPYIRKLLIRMVGWAGGTDAIPVLTERLLNDSNPECRRIAAYYLGRVKTDEALQELIPGLSDSSPLVRTAACRGLKDCGLASALDAVISLLDDTDLYVRRSAAVTAISLGYKEGITILLESMKIKTLDTTENYGDNLFAALSEYVGPELLERFGIDLDKWLAWWNKNGKDFDLQGALKAKTERDKNDFDD